MYVYHPDISKLLLWLEFLSTIVALLYYNRVKHTYWKWFVYYLLFILLIEMFGESIFKAFSIEKKYYFAYIGIPIEYLFFYWLYAVNSIKNRKLFWIFSSIFLLSFIPIELYFSKLNIVYSLNITIGTLLLMILVLLEFNKQIKNDNIIEFKTNKMFYINTGVMLFYIGTLPFFGLYNLLLQEPSIWNIYYTYFLVSNCVMYLLFTLSFICGKVKS